jgi:hypothetical protein
MVETLCVRNAPPRYVVSIGNKILIVTHDYNYAKRVEQELIRKKVTDGSGHTVGRKR